MAVVNAYFELGVDAARSRRRSEPARSARLAAPHDRLAAQARRGRRGRRRQHAARARRSRPATSPRCSWRRSCSSTGANPNTRVEWKEPTFGKEGGTARNPPNIQLGRHLLSYIGATPFYVAAKNGDVAADAAARRPRRRSDDADQGRHHAADGGRGLDYWEGESPGPFTGVTEAERLEAVKLALELGNDINAHANFGDYRMDGDVDYTLLYYPHNIDELLDLGVGDPRWSGSTPLIGAVISGQPSIVQFLVDRGARLDAKTALGWTPLKVAEGVFFATPRRSFPPRRRFSRRRWPPRLSRHAEIPAGIAEIPAAHDFSRTAASRRAASGANAGVGPFQRSSSTESNSGDVGAQRREIAEQERALALAGERARQRRRAGGVDAPRAPVVGNRFEMAEIARAPPPPTSRPSPADRDSRRRRRRRAPGSRESTPAARRTSRSTPASSTVVRVRRFSCTTRVPRTHCARSLSGVQMITRSTRGSRAAAAAAAASASSASNSTIGQTTMPSAASASSSSGNCASRSGVDAGAGLVARPQPVAERLDDVIGRDARCAWRRR